MASPKPFSWLSDKDYDFIFSRVPRLCVDIIIRTNEGVLLTFRKIPPAKNSWHIPGGRVYFRESLEKAVIRIAKKETGLKVEIQKQLGSMEFDREIQYGKKRHSVSIAFLVKPIGGVMKGDFQSEALQFFKKIPQETYGIHGDFLRKQGILK